MKHLPTILFVSTAFGLCLLVTTLIMELRKENDMKQKEIDGLKRTNEKQRDSLEHIIILKDDTIRIAKFTIISQADTIKNQELEKQNYKRNTHDKIRFIPYANDFQRDSVLTSLYPSFRPF